jgi:hypothetical protein
MKRWVLSVFISLIPLIVVAIYYYQAIEQAICLNSGGSWLGVFKGCDFPVDGGFYSITISPISGIIVFSVWLLVIFLISSILKRFKILSSNGPY